MSGSNSGLARTSLRGIRVVRSSWLLTSGSGECTVVAICLAPNSDALCNRGKQLARMHQEMFDCRTKRKRREKREGGDQHHGADKQTHKQRPVGRERSAGDG